MQHYPAKGLDAAVESHFRGVTCKTTFDVVAVKHVTVFTAKNSIQGHLVELYIEAFLAGNQELSNRLTAQTPE